MLLMSVLFYVTFKLSVTIIIFSHRFITVIELTYERKTKERKNLAITTTITLDSKNKIYTLRSMKTLQQLAYLD